MRLQADDLWLRYGREPVIRGVTLTVESGEFCVVVGANASGKSTLLRGLARVMRPSSGTVRVDDEDISALPPREVARRLAILPQMQQFDIDLAVEELVWRGRTPYQRLLQPMTAEDTLAVERALEAVGLLTLRDRPLRTLSGGERQRTWLALTLAQEPQILLLDEPTTYLDLRHQVEVMDVLKRLNHKGMTIVAVLHDLALASRYAHRIVGLGDGEIVLDGPPTEVFTPESLERVFGLGMVTLTDPATGRPLPFPA